MLFTIENTQFTLAAVQEKIKVQKKKITKNIIIKVTVSPSIWKMNYERVVQFIDIVGIFACRVFRFWTQNGVFTEEGNWFISSYTVVCEPIKT